jgi:hypothetical protein
MMAKWQKGLQMSSSEKKVCCLSNMIIPENFSVISFMIDNNILGYAIPKSFLNFLQNINLDREEKRKLVVLCRNLRKNAVITIYLNDLPENIRSELKNKLEAVKRAVGDVKFYFSGNTTQFDPNEYNIIGGKDIKGSSVSPLRSTFGIQTISRR